MTSEHFSLPLKAPKTGNYDVFPSLVVLTLISISIWLAQYHWKRRKLYKQAEKFRGPRAYPIIGSSLEFAGSPTAILSRLLSLYEEYDPTFKVWFGTRLFIGLSKPEHMEIIMNNQHCLQKEDAYKFVQDVVGTGLFSAPVSKWRKNRKIISPTFNPKILDSFVEVFVQQSEVLLDVLKKHTHKDDVEVYEIMTATSLDIICETAMGVKVNAQTSNSPFGKWVDYVMMVVFLRMFIILFQFDFIFNQTKLAKKYWKTVKKMHAFTDKVVVERREKFEKKMQALKDEHVAAVDEGAPKMKAFLDLLLDLTHEGIKFSDQELREEVDTFTVGGSDTTATTMCFAFTMFGIHQDVQQKIYEEVIDVLGYERAITAEDLPKLKYLERCIKETLRIFPPAAFIVRKLLADVDLGDGLVIPSGASAFLGIIHTHRSAKNWENPLKFDPDRFLPERLVNKNPYSFVAFSGGPRGCIGRRYSIMALKCVLSTVVRQYKIYCGYKSLEDIEIKTNLVLRPVNGFKVRFEPRETSF